MYVCDQNKNVIEICFEKKMVFEQKGCKCDEGGLGEVGRHQGLRGEIGTGDLKQLGWEG